MSKEPYPACQKLNVVRNDKAILLCFLEWLEENNLKICRSVSAAGYFPVYSPEKLLMEYFGIDEVQLEKERQKVLKEQRKLNKEKT